MPRRPLSVLATLADRRGQASQHARHLATSDARRVLLCPRASASGRSSLLCSRHPAGARLSVSLRSGFWIGGGACAIGWRVARAPPRGGPERWSPSIAERCRRPRARAAARCRFAAPSRSRARGSDAPLRSAPGARDLTLLPAVYLLQIRVLSAR